MNWFSNLFKKDVGSSGYIQPDQPWPRMTEYPPMPEVKPPKPEKNISKPVFAIVECMKKYPSRFKIVSDETEQCGVNNRDKVRVRDVKTNQEIFVHIVPRIWESWSWQWLTRDEKDFLKEAFENMIQVKKDRMHSIQRAKMKGIYK